MYSNFQVTAQVSADTMTYTEIDPPDPPMTSFSNDQFAAIETVMAIYAHVGCLQLLQGVNMQLCRIVATIFASTIYRECIRIVFRSTLNK